MAAIRPVVSVVDDDESVRESVSYLLRGFGFDARAFASAEEFLASNYLPRTDCLVLDFALPGMTGPALQLELWRQQRSIPIVFLTGRRDEHLRQRLLDSGASACLFKPFSDSTLLDAIRFALRPA